MIALATLLVGVSLGLPSFAQWATPGAACTQEGANANSNGFLTCTGGVWVSNAVLMGTTAAACDAGKAGYIRYNSGSFEGCNGSAWVQLAGGSSNPTYLGTTTTTYNGNLNGYSGANAKCVAQFGTGARMITLTDIVKLGRTTAYSVSGWFSCRVEANQYYIYSSSYPYATNCGGFIITDNNIGFDCSNYTSNSGIGLYLSNNASDISAASCGGGLPIHCVRD